MRYLVVIAILAAWAMSSSGVEAYYLDTPHNESNGIYCDTCHGMTEFTVVKKADWAVRTAVNPDDTLPNAVCLKCHSGAAVVAPLIPAHQGPTMMVHSSTTTHSATTWSTNCTQCHDVHFQGQLDWAGTEMFLATGSFDEISGHALTYTAAASGADYTTIGINSAIVARAGWGDVSTWKAKGGWMDGGRARDGSRGLVLVPSLTYRDQTYEILDVAEVSGNLVIKVKGKMGGDEAYQGANFGVIYGQSIRALVMPNGGTSVADYRNVKFFQPGITPGTYGGFVDETAGATKPVGICQVCHTSATAWRGNGSAATHHADTNCSSCHNILAGGHANSAPIAHGGVDQNVATGVTVILNGSASSDADGDPLTYSWSFVSRPSGSSAALIGAATAGPTFVADVAGTYVVSLVVNDGQVDSAADLVAITVVTPNHVPVADAGPDQNVGTGHLVTLNGSGSSDADGDPLTYSWSFTSRPDGSNAAIAGVTTANPTFTTDVAGSYVVSLVVNDGKENSTAAIVHMTAISHLVTYAYDVLNRLTDIFYGDGAHVEYQYDAAGNFMAVISHNAP